jgi:choline dehydrogenase
VLADGVELARDLVRAAPPELAAVEELWPGPAVATRGELLRQIDRAVSLYYHPGCSCRMGPADDPLAVVAADGAVHGLAGLSICDASIFPALMRANTNLPAAMLAEHLAPTLGAL